MFIDGDVARALRASDVAGDTFVVKKDLDGPIGQSDVDPPSDEAVRHGIERLVDLDMVIGMHLGDLPFRILKRRRRQWFELGALDFIEQSAPGFAISPHRSVIEVVDQSADADIEIDKAEESLVSKSGQDPPLDD